MAPSFSIGRFPLRMHDNTSFVLQLTVWSKHCILCCLSGELGINMSLSKLGNLVTKPQCITSKEGVAAELYMHRGSLD